MRTFRRVGLVLKGGCQEGAYQAGVVMALAERGISVEVISGEGVGALNAAIIASASSTATAADRLVQVWEELSLNVENEASLPVYLKYCLSAGHHIHYSKRALRLLTTLAKRTHVNLGIDTETGLLENNVLSEMLKEYWNEETLKTGKPFYIVTFKTSSYLKGIGVGLLSLPGRLRTPPSEAVKIQQLDPRIMVPMVLSSTATPLLFNTFRYNRQYHFDGRIGSVKSRTLHPLVTPLIKEQCDLIIAPFGETLLRDVRSPVLNISPLTPLARSTGLTGAFVDHFCLEPGIVARWGEQGYHDTLTILDLEEKKGVLRDVSDTPTPEQPYYDAVQSVEDEIREEKS